MAVRRLAGPGAVSGPARVDRRTKRLIERLQPGDVAVVDHEDLDRIAAEGLVESGVVAVINAAPSISGRYPNVGPLLLAAAGIAVVDGTGPAVLDLPEGRPVRVEGGAVWSGSRLVAEGQRQDLRSLEAAYESAKESIGDELARFAANTLEYLQREQHVLLEPLAVPELRTPIRGQHVLVVVRGHDYREDLAALRSYVREMKPVLVGVDGGADALRDAGLAPDLVIGDFDSVSEEALTAGSELVVHGYPGGEAPGAARLEELGLPHLVVEAPGTSEDLALLLAHQLGAELIVAVGTHSSVVDFLDKGRAGMASTFLTRLKVGPILLDAKGVSRLYPGRIRKRDLTFFLAAAMLCFLAIFLLVTPRVFVESLWLILRDLWGSAS